MVSKLVDNIISEDHYVYTDIIIILNKITLIKTRLIKNEGLMWKKIIYGVLSKIFILYKAKIEV